MQRLHPLLFCLIGGLFLFSQVQAQDAYRLYLRSGERTVSPNTEAFILSPQISSSEQYGDGFFKGLQFHDVPTAAQKAEMKREGILLMDYLPNNAFLAYIPNKLPLQQLNDYGVRAIFPFDATDKMHPQLLNRPLPDHALRGDKVEVIVQYYPNVTLASVSSWMNQKGYEVLNTYDYNHQLTLLVDEQEINDLASLPFFYNLELPSPTGEPEDVRGRGLQRANTLSPAYSGGRNYDGSGVAISVRDDGAVGPHIDFTGRFRIVANPNTAANRTHGDGVAGIFVGAGNLDPYYHGMASGAFMFVQQYRANFQDSTLLLHQLFDMKITNSSYSDGCNGYTTITQTVDRQVFQNPTLMHVFSAGNNNNNNCGYGAGNQWGNITGGHKMGKNVIATANLFADDQLANSSSRGPANDGRIKPDMAAHGQGQGSTGPNNGYTSFGGTSAAAPSLAGTMTQLYQAYKELNGEKDAPTALLKAVMMNTSDDLGNPGPDFKYGYGRINAYRAIQVLENEWYIKDTITQATLDRQTLQVPSGLAELRIMVYWADPAASPAVSRALVNNLDMEVRAPGQAPYLPWVLDPTPNPVTLDLPATRGRDILNNVEQVTIENPVAGTYQINVAGASVPQGPQEYYVVYEFVAEDLTVIYPYGGEGFAPGEVERLHWDAVGNTRVFRIEYSADNGATWKLIDDQVPGNQRLYDWSVPADITGQALVRISRGSTVGTSSRTFSIVGVPQNIRVLGVCPSFTTLTWDPVSGATGYDVMMLGNEYMDSIATTSNTIYSLQVANGGSNWYTVRAVGPNGMRGRRAVAIQNTLAPGPCNTQVDAALISLDDPTPRSLIPSCQDSQVVQISLLNLGTLSLTNLPVAYQFNNGPVINDTIPGVLGTGGASVLSFPLKFAVPAPGVYTMKAWVGAPGDQDVNNDTVSTLLQVDNSTVVTSYPYTQDFEGFSTCNVAPNCEQDNCLLTDGWRNYVNQVVDDIDWRTDDQGTFSQGTGPSVDHNPGTAAGNFLYLEASGGCSFRTAELLSPCFDLSGMTAPEFSFWYHMLGADMGELHVDLRSGSDWILDVIPPVSGNQGNQWFESLIDLTPYAGQTINIRFRGITGGDFASDLAIDDVQLYETAVAPTADFSSDNQTVCLGGTAEFSSTSRNATTFNWQVQPSTFAFVNGTSATSPQPVIQFNGLGAYTVTLVATNAFGADTITKTSYISATAGLSLPVSQNMENYNNCATTNNCGATICGLGGGWENSPNGDQDDIDWRVDNGGTPSNGTGPNLDFNPGTTFGKYLYLEASNGCNQQAAHLVSTCLDLQNAVAPELTFRYHMLGDDMGELHVDLDDGSGWINDIIPPVSGDQGNVWVLATADLSPWNGSVIRIRIRGITGTGFESDMAIDDIRIRDQNLAPVANLSTSVRTTCVGNLVDLIDQSQYAPTSWQWSITPSTFNYANNTSATDQNPQVVFTQNGTYNVQLTVSSPNGNDFVVKNAQVVVSNGTAPPVQEDFQSGTVVPVNWVLTNPDQASTWDTLTVIGSGGTNTVAAFVDNFNYNAPGQEDWLTSFSIDLSQVTNPELTFEYAYAAYAAGNADELRVELSEDCGQTFTQTIFQESGQNLSTTSSTTRAFVPTASTDWQTDTIDLSAYIGKVIKIRFINVNAYGNRLFLDNINLGVALRAPIAGFSQSATDICAGDTITYTDQSSTFGNAAYAWDFGVDAVPATANTVGPHKVVYTSAGSKTVTLDLTNASGQDISQSTVQVTDVPAAAFNFQITGQTVAFSQVSTGANTYQWDFGDGITNTLPSPTHVFAQTNVYTVVLVACNDCGCDTTTQEVDLRTSSLTELQDGGAVQLYPNPANNFLILEAKGLKGNNFPVKVFDAQGRQVAAYSFAVRNGQVQTQLDLSDWSNGVYMVNLRGERFVKVVKR